MSEQTVWAVKYSVAIRWHFNVFCWREWAMWFNVFTVIDWWICHFLVCFSHARRDSSWCWCYHMCVSPHPCYQCATDNPGLWQEKETQDLLAALCFNWLKLKHKTTKDFLWVLFPFFSYDCCPANHTFSFPKILNMRIVILKHTFWA